MDDNKNLEEANKEVEKSKIILHDSENAGKKENIENEDKTDEKEVEGSGIFTADGKELPKIEGGYDIINPGSNFNENEIISV